MEQLVRIPRTLEGLKEGFSNLSFFVVPGHPIPIQEETNRRRNWLKRLERVEALISENCPQLIYSCIAYGPPLRRLLLEVAVEHVDILYEDTGWLRHWRPRYNIQYLGVITLPIEKWFEANRALAEGVFGPILIEFNWIPRLDIWTKEEFELAKEENHKLWQEAVRSGITIYGEQLLPPYLKNGITK